MKWNKSSFQTTLHSCHRTGHGVHVTVLEAKPPHNRGPADTAQVAPLWVLPWKIPLQTQTCRNLSTPSKQSFGILISQCNLKTSMFKLVSCLLCSNWFKTFAPLTFKSCWPILGRLPFQKGLQFDANLALGLKTSTVCYTEHGKT